MVSEEWLIGVLQDFNRKLDDKLKAYEIATGRKLREYTEEETGEYRKYIKSKLYGNGDHPYPGRNH
jgi:hypothetical protein